MDKSQCLDELRMEVGLAADYANSLSDFYNGIIIRIGQRLEKEYAIAIYITNGNKFQLVSSSGMLSEQRFETFGDGPFSLCAIRGKTIVHTTGNRNQIIAPFYIGHHLQGILMAEFPYLEYEITEEDFIFMNEVCRFIEKNYCRFKDISESY